MGITFGQGLSEQPGIGGFFENPEEAALARKFQEASERAREASARIGSQRPIGYAGAMSAFAPANAMLQHMYGPEFAQNFGTLSQATRVPYMVGGEPRPPSGPPDPGPPPPDNSRGWVSTRRSKPQGFNPNEQG